jgi:hypothetical protein
MSEFYVQNVWYFCLHIILSAVFLQVVLTPGFR